MGKDEETKGRRTKWNRKDDAAMSRLRMLLRLSVDAACLRTKG